jgi:predicted phosphodiesterase
MRLGIISDVHGNIPALEAVLKELVYGQSVDAIYCLGDVVGYGAQGQKCVDYVSGMCDTVIQGNHDYSLGKPGEFASFGRHDIEASLAFTRAQLTPKQIDWLNCLPHNAKAIIGGVSCAFAHGSVIDDDRRWDYVQMDGTLRQILEMNSAGTDVVFTGHTHKPGVIRVERLYCNDMQFGELAFPGRYLINVGSVGQPRDCCNLASCVVCTVESGKMNVQLVRVQYDIRKAQEAIRQAKLEHYFANRLTWGD